MAKNYLTKIYSKNNNSYDIKDSEAVSSLSLIIDSNTVNKLLPDEDGNVTIDLSSFHTGKATDTSLGTVIIKKSYDSIDNTDVSLEKETSLSINSKGVLIADVPLKGLKIENNALISSEDRYKNLLIDKDTKTITINTATTEMPGLIKLGNNVKLDNISYNAYLLLGSETDKKQFNNICIENTPLVFNSEIEAGIKKANEVTGGNISLHNAYTSFTTKDYIYNTIIDYNKYLNDKFTTKIKTDEIEEKLNSIINDDNSSLFNKLINNTKFSKKFINGVSELPNIASPDNSIYNTLYILKSKNDEYYGNYVYTPKKINNSYKWTCISSPVKPYEIEDIDFDKEFKKYYSYSKISTSRSFTNFNNLNIYLKQQYDSNSKSKYIINGEKVDGVKAVLVANGEVFDYTMFEIIITKQNETYQYYFYTPEYNEGNKYIIQTTSSSNKTLYNQKDITTELFSPEEN